MRKLDDILGLVLRLGAVAACACACDRGGASSRSVQDQANAALADPQSAKPASNATPATRVAPAFGERCDERSGLVRQLAEEGIHDQAVLAAMKRVPRHAFVSAQWRSDAYADHPLPIVGGQTISQPYIVAVMTEAAKPSPTAKCLEIGTGSGYQAAILAELCGATYSIEYLPDVARFGEQNLRSLGYGPDRVALRVGDGYAGWPEAAPFDVILVTAAPTEVPRPLLEQLAVGGRLVVPVGDALTQELVVWTRLNPGAEPGALRRQRLLPVRFVPFLGAGERAHEGAPQRTP